MARQIRPQILADVIGIIDEQIADARATQTYPDMCEDHKYGWLCRERALQELRDRLLDNREVD